MTRHALIAAAALLCFTAAAHAQDADHGTVKGSTIAWERQPDGQIYFHNGPDTGDAFRGLMTQMGTGFIGRTHIRPGAFNPTYYRPDLGIIVDLDTGLICWNVGTDKADCK